MAKAINALLAGLPIQLHDGSISSVTARIPWPNPLTASIGLSVQSLHLTFHLDPAVSATTTSQQPDLADSVFSVAESFMHDELTPGEEATLLGSIHPEYSAPPDVRANVPGGLDPFINLDEVVPPDVDPAGVSVFATLIERLLARFEFDAADITVTLVHPGNASFTLRTAKINYGKANETSPAGSETKAVTVDGFQIAYQDLTPLRKSGSPSFDARPTTLATPQQHFPSSPSPPASPEAQSDSDMDEETNLMMSQSLASLPARPASPASTVASSMFQSAISTVPEESDTSASSLRRSPSPTGDRLPITNESQTFPTQPLSPSNRSPNTETTELQEETLLSIALEPLVITLTTMLGSHLATQEETVPGGPGQVTVSVTVGVIACALRARHIRSVLMIMDSLPSSPRQRVTPSLESRPNTESGSSSIPSFLDQVEASLRLRGVVFLFLPSDQTSPSSRPAKNDSSTSTDTASLPYFFSRPLVPPRLRHPFLRLFIDTVQGSSSLNTSRTIPHGPIQGHSSRSQNASTHGATYTTTGTFTIHDVSFCAFQLHDNATVSPDSVEHIVTPILITDLHLASQYPAQHSAPLRLEAHHDQRATPPLPPQLPTFDALDWTSTFNHVTQPKLSRWRIRAPHLPAQGVSGSPYSPPGSLPADEVESSTSRHAMSFSFRSSSSMLRRNQPLEQQHNPVIDVDFAPLHIFVDLALMDCSEDGTVASEALRFLDEISDRPASHIAIQSVSPPVDSDVDSDLTPTGDNEDDGPTPPPSPRRRQALLQKQREDERRQRLDRYWIEDLGLSMEYNVGEPRNIPQHSSKRHTCKQQVSQQLMSPFWRCSQKAIGSFPEAARDLHAGNCQFPYDQDRDSMSASTRMSTSIWCFRSRHPRSYPVQH